MRRIAIVTSGGDAPGMNTALNAAYQMGRDLGIELVGVRRGYEGLSEGDFVPFDPLELRESMNRGGTILGTARYEAFITEEIQQQAIRHLADGDMEGLIVIGGNGSQRGSLTIHTHGFPVVGIASTVDNDLYGSDVSIGVDTALNTIIDSLDRIGTTADSHHRAFLVEVMGRDYGYLALMSGIASGAEVIVTPEFEMEPEEVARELRLAHDQGKRYAIAVVTDGAKNGVEKIADYIEKHPQEFDFELRMTILGHVQRGGSPTVFDRYLATRLGSAAVQALRDGKRGVLAGWRDSGVAYVPLREVVSGRKDLNVSLWRLALMLSK
ncbi:MAG: ATP-dependent 6-phosphofructokinase [Actinomycetota bacterium]|nr:ATP-dependent 6-phosphofructokinase [Actinomycetota bacterium]MDD5667276.1 ATP-dependent 6-phosphofructokinase [Actinomycetota bacterium]